MNRRLYNFMHSLTGEQQVQFATQAKTTVGTIRHYVSERRHPSAATAIAMERAALRMRRKDATLPELSRGDLSGACKGCEFFKLCTERLA